MKKLLLCCAVHAVALLTLFAQNPVIPIPGIRILSDSIPKNGSLDRIEDLSLRVEVPFTMPDGVKLRGDVFLPIFQDSMTFNFDLLGNSVNLEVMKKGRSSSSTILLMVNPIQTLISCPSSSPGPLTTKEEVLKLHFFLFWDMAASCKI
jgi:hypothetical protein